MTLEYPVAENEGEEDNTYLSYNMVVGNAADSQMAMAFEVLGLRTVKRTGSTVKAGTSGCKSWARMSMDLMMMVFSSHILQ